VGLLPGAGDGRWGIERLRIERYTTKVLPTNICIHYN
jgi:hypothetical protein